MNKARTYTTFETLAQIHLFSVDLKTPKMILDFTMAIFSKGKAFLLCEIEL